MKLSLNYKNFNAGTLLFCLVLPEIEKRPRKGIVERNSVFVETEIILKNMDEKVFEEE